MVKHIVFWKLKPEVDGSTASENARRMKAVLEELCETVPGIVALEVGINFNPSDAAYDVALYSEFESRAGLESYQKHPDHVAAAEFVKSVVSGRAVVDYEL
ncbi:MAG: Dabb family protein [Spirochaetaceae bacterium]|nr:MAG: Dabb family protein [Spirochaetaceae bacterium]